MSRARQPSAGSRPPTTEPELLLRAELGAAGTVTCLPGAIVGLPDDETLVATLAGERRPRDVRIELAGRRLDRRGPAGRVRAGFAVVRGTEVAPDVTVLDHLVAVAGHRRAFELLADVRPLAGRGGAPAGILSGGERRLLGWLLARAAEPRLVLLDRAGTGLDEAALGWAHRVVDGWLDAGAGVLLRQGRIEEARWRSHRADGRPRARTGRV
jgi:ABC-type branched-subunit amino acid transport system ATPase component